MVKLMDTFACSPHFCTFVKLGFVSKAPIQNGTCICLSQIMENFKRMRQSISIYIYIKNINNFFLQCICQGDSLQVHTWIQKTAILLSKWIKLWYKKKPGHTSKLLVRKPLKLDFLNSVYIHLLTKFNKCSSHFILITLIWIFNEHNSGLTVSKHVFLSLQTCRNNPSGHDTHNALSPIGWNVLYLKRRESV